MEYTVDRIEGKHALCEDENKDVVAIPLDALPFVAKEGLTFESNEDGSFSLVESDRAQRITALSKKLWD